MYFRDQMTVLLLVIIGMILFLTLNKYPQRWKKPEKDLPSSIIFQVNPNDAEASELISIPEIGPKLADQIILCREKNGAFNEPKDLEKVRGIGPKKAEQIEPFLYFPNHIDDK